MSVIQVFPSVNPLKWTELYDGEVITTLTYYIAERSVIRHISTTVTHTAGSTQLTVSGFL